MSNTTYYQRNKDVILSRVKDYYKNYKKQARDKYRNLSEEEIICLLSKCVWRKETKTKRISKNLLYG